MQATHRAPQQQRGVLLQRMLTHHPHVHMIVPGGGISIAGHVSLDQMKVMSAIERCRSCP